MGKRRVIAVMLVALERMDRELAHQRQLNAGVEREIHDRLDRLDVRLTALEQHITNFGPKVRRSDPNVVGCPSWQEPYRPPLEPARFSMPPPSGLPHVSPSGEIRGR